ncbi:MAG: Rpn family recombination-promoting nuclease/putative transposase [Puniceicoccales bacterium]|jgi:hypothetical protein|nr:Rpn family recombination-promoting nuclease/putative transposase [Puniceicoccales bacterium]
MNQYNDFMGSGTVANDSGRTHFIRATSDVGFKIIMSDPRIAEALINELFEHIHIASVSITSPGKLKVPLHGRGPLATIEHHAIMENQEHIIIEMQMIRHDSFDRRTLFYAASAFARQEVEGDEWASRIRKIKSVYSIQFVDYFTHGGIPIKCYEMVNKFSPEPNANEELLPLETLPGIHMIQVELKGEGIRDLKFPASGKLSNLEWWYYMIKYSDQFDADEIKRCRGLGMPECIAQALEKLEYSSLDPQKQAEYVTEVKNIDTNNKELERAALKAELKGLEEKSN